MEIPNRYDAEERAVIVKTVAKIEERTRKGGRMRESAKTDFLEKCEGFDKRAVISAMRIYLKMDIPKSKGGKGKNERYLLGIISNKQVEMMRDEKPEGRAYETEGDRIAKIAGSFGDGERECGF